jgi:transcriptional regulator with XRE-family HTH domain
MTNIHSKEYKHFLQKLRQARQSVNLTQQEVAKRLGKHQSYVSKCESGERRVDVVELSCFAALYNRKISDFVR